ncbi:MAG: SDR family oxidoreductase [Pseudomonadota bacterium]
MDKTNGARDQTRRTLKAIVTGHTHGLGAAIALTLARRHIPVLGIARGHSDKVELSAQASISLDDAAAVATWLASGALQDYLAGCDEVLLINNAGTVQPVGPLSDQDPLQVARAITLNVAAPLMLAAAVVQATQGKQRRILHISSGAASSAYPGWSVYCATKAALDQHARAVALDAQPGVRICSLAPGVIDTAMQAEIRATPAERFPIRQRFVDMKRDGHLAAPEERAEQIIDYLLAAGFGENPVDDIRNA